MKNTFFVLFMMAFVLLAEETNSAAKKSDAPENKSATLIVETEPAGATVILDGTEKLTTPFTKEVSAGAHTLVFKKKGYYGKKLKFTLPEGKTIKKTITLRAPAKLTLASTPVGATVLLAGDSVGLTPYTSKALKPGDYALKLSKEGYESLEQKLSLGSGENKDLSLELKALIVETRDDSTPEDESIVNLDTVKTEDSSTVAEATEDSATVDTVAANNGADTTSTGADTTAEESVDRTAKDADPVDAVPTAGLKLLTEPASVFAIIDNSDTLITPFTQPLTPGEHEIVLKKKGFYGKKIVVTIPADSVITQKVTLRAPSYLSISADADSCRILLNKESVGYTPFTSKPLKPGTYELIVLKNGYETQRTSVVIAQGEHKKLELAMVAKEGTKPVVTKKETVEEKKERKKVAIVAGAVFGAFLTMLTAFELSGVGE